MANQATATQTVNPVVSQQEVTEKLTEVKVTVIEDKEIAAILHADTDKVISLAFSLQDTYENASQYRKDALQEASVMFLKAQCARTVAQWDNLVTRFSKTMKYRNVGRIVVEQKLKDNPKTRPIWNLAAKAIEIKKSL